MPRTPSSGKYIFDGRASRCNRTSAKNVVIGSVLLFWVLMDGFMVAVTSRMHHMVRYPVFLWQATSNSSWPGAGICAERTAVVKAVVGIVSTQYLTGPRITDMSVEEWKSTKLSCSRCGVVCFMHFKYDETIIYQLTFSDIPSPSCSPCGICRQFLREFVSLDTPIFYVSGEYPVNASPSFLADINGKEAKKYILQTTMGEILPHSFGPDHLLMRTWLGFECCKWYDADLWRQETYWEMIQNAEKLYIYIYIHV